MPWMKLFETLVNGLSILDYCRGSFVLEVGRVLGPALKRNAETIYLFIFIFMFVYESYLLLNLRQMIYEFSLKYFKSYFVTMFIKLRCNNRNLSGSVKISIINTRFCKLLRFLTDVK